MTRKDYIFIAQIFKTDIDFYGHATGFDEPDEFAPINIVRSTAQQFADALARDNAKFDRDRFLKAAGVRD